MNVGRTCVARRKSFFFVEGIWKFDEKIFLEFFTKKSGK